MPSKACSHAEERPGAAGARLEARRALVAARAWSGSASTRLRIVSFPELRGAPTDGGGDALGSDDFAEPLAELGPRRVERAEDVEPGIKRGAEAGGVGAAVDRALRRVERFRGDQREALRPAQACLAQFGERHDAVDHAE